MSIDALERRFDGPIDPELSDGLLPDRGLGRALARLNGQATMFRRMAADMRAELRLRQAEGRLADLAPIAADLSYYRRCLDSIETEMARLAAERNHLDGGQSGG